MARLAQIVVFPTENVGLEIRCSRLRVDMGHLGVSTWANLSQLGTLWIVLNLLGWFWVRFGLVLVDLGSVLVEFGIRFRFVLGSFVSLSFRVDAASVSFSIPLSHPRQPSDTRSNRNTRTP